MVDRGRDLDRELRVEARLILVAEPAQHESEEIERMLKRRSRGLGVEDK